MGLKKAEAQIVLFKKIGLNKAEVQIVLFQKNWP